MPSTPSFSIHAAPLQGITTHLWRTAHHTVFGGCDDYAAPFMRVERGAVRRHDLTDVTPGLNAGVPLVPQIIACQPADAVLMAHTLVRLGYQRIDVNLGCPFPPLALHGKGAGLLPHPDKVQTLFMALAGVPGVRYSVKMRLGWDDATQWQHIMPLLHIIQPVRVVIHPRIGRQQYKGAVNMDQFNHLLQAAQYPVVYNGDIATPEQISALRERYPSLAGVMVGRGLAARPAMLCPERATPAHYRTFHDLLLEGYRNEMTGGDHQVLARMKALWEYFLPDAPHRARKAVKKATTLPRYMAAVDACF